jgi:hypothetical protein
MYEKWDSTEKASTKRVKTGIFEFQRNSEEIRETLQNKSNRLGLGLG